MGGAKEQAEAEVVTKANDKETTGTETKEPTYMDELNTVLKAETERVSESKAPEKKSKGPAGTPAGKSGSDAEPTGEDKEPEPGDQGDDAGEPGKNKQGGDDGEELPAIDEGLLERAVRAGLPLADAKAFPNGEALGRVVERLEAGAAAATKDGGPDASGSKEKGAGAEEDPLAKIPDLDPEEYDEKLVAAFKSVKELAGRLIGDNKELRARLDGITSKDGTWIDREVAALGKDYADVFGVGNAAELSAGDQARARARLARHIEFVQSEAKAEGRALGQKDAFKLALELAFGDKVKNTMSAAAAEAARQRAQRTVNRPRDTSGRFASDGASEHGTEGDREADAVEAVKKFYEDA